MKGVGGFADGVDLTAPSDLEWGAFLDTVH